MQTPRPTRRRALASAASCAAAAMLPWNAHADGFPSRAVTLVVPFPPGGTTDALARLLGQHLGASLGQQVVIENKPGAGSTLGAEAVAKAAPDGHTLLMGAVHHTIAPAVYGRLGYDFTRDLAPVTVIAAVPNVLVVNPEVPARSVAGLIALARSQRGRLSFGSNGNGTAQHLIAAQFQAMAGVTMIHVPYRGSGPLTVDLMAGQVQLSFDTITPVLPHIRSGKLRALAVTTAARSPALPDVPTLAESGLPGFDLGSWFGILVPAATPPKVVERLNADLVKALSDDEVRKRFAELGAVPVGNTPEQMAQQIRDDTARFGKLAREAKISVE